MKTPGVYTFTCVPANRVYIGSSADVHNRRDWHTWALRHSRHHITQMQADWDAYGEDAFVFDVVAEIADRDQRLLVEQALLDARWLDGRAYNKAPGVISSTGVPLTDEHKRAISSANKDRPKTAEHRAKLGDAHRALWEGKEITPEFRAQMAELASRGKGQAKSEEHKRKISEAQKGRPKSPEHLANLRAAGFGASKPLKLTAEQIPEIRRRLAAGESMPSIAAAFGVKPASISDIKHGRSWRHIT